MRDSSVNSSSQAAGTHTRGTKSIAIPIIFTMAHRPSPGVKSRSTRSHSTPGVGESYFMRNSSNGLLPHSVQGHPVRELWAIFIRPGYGSGSARQFSVPKVDFNLDVVWRSSSVGSSEIAPCGTVNIRLLRADIGQLYWSLRCDLGFDGVRAYIEPQGNWSLPRRNRSGPFS